MVGRDEKRYTYPLFLSLPDGRLVFWYRTGESGNGDWILNVYDPASRSWRRLLDRPLFDGQGHRNAYPLAPVAGPDGLMHVSWVWRESPDCKTNHDLCYARSRDLVHWETAAGEPLVLPITVATPGVVVDPVPVEGGLLNGTGQVGFDHTRRAVLAYHRYDAAGRSQAFLARWERGTWRTQRLTAWDHRFDFGGRGSLPNDSDISFSAVRPGAKGELRLDFRHVKFGAGAWVIDEESLTVSRTEPAWPTVPPDFTRRRGVDPRFEVRWAEDSGSRPEVSETRFVLRWETLPANRDQPRDPPWPEQSLLQVLEVRDWSAAGH